MRLSRVARVSLFVALTCVTLVNHLTTRLWGLLVLVAGAYVFIPKFTDVRFIPISEAVATILALPTETLLTGLGLITAYFIAVITWRQQKAFEIRLASSSKFSAFYTEAAQEALKLELFVERLRDLYDSDQKGRSRNT